jgi:hypothetical protein
MVEKRGKGSGTLLLLLLALGACTFGAYLLYYALSRTVVDKDALRLGVPMLAAGLLLLTAFLWRTLGRTVALVAFVALGAGTASFVYGKTQADLAGDLEAANREYKLYRLWRVCHGWSYPEAQPPATGLQPTAILATTDEGSWQPWRNSHPPGWEPGSVEAAVYVACVRTVYGGGHGDPHRTTVRLVAVANGTLVAETTLSHTAPSDRPVLEWLRPWVEGGAR